MARVTVEDCIDKVPNRFELVLLATHRARALANGSHITIDPENDKNAVIALREIAERTIQPSDVASAAPSAPMPRIKAKAATTTVSNPARLTKGKCLVLSLNSPPVPDM